MGETARKNMENIGWRTQWTITPQVDILWRMFTCNIHTNIILETFFSNTYSKKTSLKDSHKQLNNYEITIWIWAIKDQEKDMAYVIATLTWKHTQIIINHSWILYKQWIKNTTVFCQQHTITEYQLNAIILINREYYSSIYGNVF